MTALLLQSDAFTVTSATNLNAATPAANLTRDVLGLDTRFTGDTVIVIDRGAVTTSFDTIAVVATTMPASATILIETSTAPAITSPVVRVATTAVGIQNPNRTRRNTFYFTFTANTHRYVRITLTGSGACDIGRLLVGSAVTMAGVRSDAERIFEDMSEVFDFKAYSTFDRAPVLLGWKVQFPFMTEEFFRNTWQPFMQSIGNTSCFLFIPVTTDPTRWQADWCYGRITARAGAKHQGFNAWVQELTMRSIYP